MPFHNNCLDNDTQKCYSCIRLTVQRDLSVKPTNKTLPKSVETETIYVNESRQVNSYRDRTINSQLIKGTINKFNLELCTVGTAQRAEQTQGESRNTLHMITDDSIYTIITNKNKLDKNHKFRMKESNQLEQKLSKKKNN